MTASRSTTLRRQAPASSPPRVLISGAVCFEFVSEFAGIMHERTTAQRGVCVDWTIRLPASARRYGGSAGNIAYNLRFLGDCGAPVACVGKDAEPYLDWLLAHGISTRWISMSEQAPTARASIVVDADRNRITAVHDGAMDAAHLHGIGAADGIEVGVITPGASATMLRHADDLARAGVPLLFQPGHTLAQFDGEELRAWIERASWIVVDERDLRSLRERTGQSERRLAAQVRALIVMRGPDGCLIRAGGDTYEIPPARVYRAADPIGCGDAHRAGLLHGILHGLDWPSSGRIASLMAAIAMESRGSQSHRFTRSEFYTRYLQNFGVRLRPAAMRRADVLAFRAR
jgi:adenosine kinase